MTLAYINSLLQAPILHVVISQITPQMKIFWCISPNFSPRIPCAIFVLIPIAYIIFNIYFYLFFRNYELLLQCSPGNHEVTLHQLIQYHMWRYRSSVFSLRNNHYTTNKERAHTPVSARSHFSLRMHTSFPWPKTKEVRLTPNDLSRNNNFPHLNYGNTSCLSFPCHLVSQLE